jgi:hypothetical protein
LAWVFTESSNTSAYGSVNGTITFNDTSYHAGGGVSGNVTFNDSSYTDSGFNPGGSVTFNDSSYNNYGREIQANCTFNDSSYNYGTITGNASFTNTAFSTATTNVFNPQQGTVYGTVDFPNGATFTLANSESWIVDVSTWTGTLAWVFNGTSYNAINITGNVTFYDSSYNSSGVIITGNGIIRQHAAAFVAWRDYATSAYITGTLTLQFPEMDILGTGLL